MLLAGYRHNQKNAIENKVVSVILPTGLLSNTETEAEKRQYFAFFHHPFIFIFLYIFIKQLQYYCLILKSQVLYVYDSFCGFC